MKVIATYLLAVLGGNTSPSSDDLKHILYSIGFEIDDDSIGLLLSEVKGRDITKLVASGRERMASFPSCSGGAIAVAAVPAGGSDVAAAAEPRKEVEEESVECVKVSSQDS